MTTYKEIRKEIEGIAKEFGLSNEALFLLVDRIRKTVDGTGYVGTLEFIEEVMSEKE